MTDNEQTRRTNDEIRATGAAWVTDTELDALLTELEQADEIIARCAADTTAADLAQEVEFLKAEMALLKERA